jgi:peptide/nickel transport system permease protein
VSALVIAPRRWLSRLTAAPAGIVVGAPLAALFTVIGLVGCVFLYVPSLKNLWTNQDLLNVLAPPGSGGHLLGTDALGRDLLARSVAGAGISLELGLAVTAVTVVIGGVVGTLAGYFGGAADRIISAVIDVTWGFPLILLAVIMAGITGPGFVSILIAVGLLNWAGFARVVRGYTLSLREREFVDAARIMQIPTWKILLRHFVPNLQAPILVMGSYYVGVTIIVEAGVSFLGLGIQPPTPSLGQMIADGRNTIAASLWPALVPGAMIALAVVGFSLLGDGLRDLLDPRLSKPHI